MICLIRISGEVGLDRDVKETLNRLRLKKKYSCVVFDKANDTQNGMIKKVKDYIAFGEISEADYKKLVEARGKKDLNGELKPFFRLHPPRKGIESKRHFGVGKGVLGNHGKEMNKLLERML